MDNVLLEAVYDQREELSKYSSDENWIMRNEEQQLNPNSNLAQIIIGVRRSGKSTMAHRALRTYPYGYINFDDKRLIPMSADKLNSLLEVVYQVYGDISHLFLDEIQNVEHWHLFVNRLLRTNLHMIITGSNSKLLSGELATHLTGRYSSIELFPFSFKEYLDYKQIDTTNQSTKNKGLMNEAFEEYLVQGGFPEVIKGENKNTYISNLFDSIVTRDIFFRYSIQYTKVFRDVALYSVNNFGHEISYNRIKNIFGLGSENTVKNYVSYLEEAFLVMTLEKFSFKKQESLRYRKVYVIDTAFISVLSTNFTPNSGYLLENIVFLELCRDRNLDHTDIYYYKQTYEVDFVIVKNGKVIELIQVTEAMDDPKTLNREVRALLAAGKEVDCDKLTIISKYSHPDKVIDEKINPVSINNWLINRKR